MIKIFTDSAAYIPDEMLKEYNIKVLPLTIVLEGKEYPENEISNEYFYSVVRETNTPPESKPVKVEDFVKAFEEEVTQGNTVIGAFLSSKLSETYKNACKAKDKLLEKYSKANITLIDTKTTGMEEGLAVLAAAETVGKGSWLEDIIEAADNTLTHTRFLFIPDSLRFLQITGKMPKAISVLGSALQLMPILTTNDGQVGLRETVHSKKRAVNRIMDVFKADIEKYGVRRVIVCHIDAKDKAEELKNMAEEIARVEVSITEMGPAIGAHVGPQTVGIVYKTVEEMPPKE